MHYQVIWIQLYEGTFIKKKIICKDESSIINIAIFHGDFELPIQFRPYWTDTCIFVMHLRIEKGKYDHVFLCFCIKQRPN